MLKADALKPEPETDACAPKRIKSNPLGLINALFILKKPDKLLKWLGSHGNPTKLIKFIVAVCNKYNDLAVDYNNFDAKNNKLLASNNQNKAVIQYFQGQNANFAAENETLRQVQKQAIVNSLIADPPIVDLPIVNSPVSHAGNKQHELSLGPSATISATAKLRCLKLQDPLELTDGKNDVLIEHWLAKIEDEMIADKDLMDTLIKRRVYVMNRVSGKAFSHLKSHAQKNATNP